jgi:hypothetical protein
LKMKPDPQTLFVLITFGFFVVILLICSFLSLRKWRLRRTGAHHHEQGEEDEDGQSKRNILRSKVLEAMFPEHEVRTTTCGLLKVHVVQVSANLCHVC